jgi:hypothetical protein
MFALKFCLEFNLGFQLPTPTCGYVLEKLTILTVSLSVSLGLALALFSSVKLPLLPHRGGEGETPLRGETRSEMRKWDMTTLGILI